MPYIRDLTLNVRGLSYLGLTRSISWLLMPWLLASPGHQQPWYWLCGIDRSLSYSTRNFNYLCHINVEEWHKCKYMFMVSLKKLARKGLTVFLNGMKIIIIIPRFYSLFFQIHVSFSLDGKAHLSTAHKDSSLTDDIVDFFLSSVGATLTEIKEVELKLVNLILMLTSIWKTWIWVNGFIKCSFTQ